MDQVLKVMGVFLVLILVSWAVRTATADTHESSSNLYRADAKARRRNALKTGVLVVLSIGSFIALIFVLMM